MNKYSQIEYNVLCDCCNKVLRKDDYKKYIKYELLSKNKFKPQVLKLHFEIYFLTIQNDVNLKNVDLNFVLLA